MNMRAKYCTVRSNSFTMFCQKQPKIACSLLGNVINCAEGRINKAWQVLATFTDGTPANNLGGYLHVVQVPPTRCYHLLAMHVWTRSNGPYAQRKKGCGARWHNFCAAHRPFAIASYIALTVLMAMKEKESAHFCATTQFILDGFKKFLQQEICEATVCVGIRKVTDKGTSNADFQNWTARAGLVPRARAANLYFSLVLQPGWRQRLRTRTLVPARCSVTGRYKCNC